MTPGVKKFYSHTIKENSLSQLFIPLCPELTSKFAALGFICWAIFKIPFSLINFGHMHIAKHIDGGGIHPLTPTP